MYCMCVGVTIILCVCKGVFCVDDNNLQIATWEEVSG